MNPLRPIRGALSALLLASVVAACSASADAAAQDPIATDVPTTAAGSDAAVVPEQGSTEAGDPCAIVTREMAEAALGEAVGEPVGKESVTFHDTSCRFTATGSPANVAVWGHYDLTLGDFEESIEKLEIDASMAIEGIGESAYRRDGSASSSRTKVAAFEEDHAVWVILEMAADAETRGTAAEALARDVLAAMR